MKACLLLVLLDRRVGRRRPSRTRSSGMSGRIFLPSGPDDAAATAPRSTTSSAAVGGGLLGGGLLGRGLLGGASWRPSSAASAAAFGRRAFFAGAFLARLRGGGALAGGSDRSQARGVGLRPRCPAPLRCARSALRCCGSTPASSLARRTSSGDRCRWACHWRPGRRWRGATAPRQGATCVRARGHEHLSYNDLGRGKARYTSRAALLILPRRPSRSDIASSTRPNCRQSRRCAAAFFSFLKSRTFSSDVGVHDVGDRAVGPVLGVVADHGLPALGPYAELLGRAARRRSAPSACRSRAAPCTRSSRSLAVCRLGPQPLGVDRRTLARRCAASAWSAGRHRAGEPVDGRRRRRTARRTPRGRPRRSRPGPGCRTGPGPSRARRTRAPSGTAGRASSRRAARTGSRQHLVGVRVLVIWKPMRPSCRRSSGRSAAVER